MLVLDLRRQRVAGIGNGVGGRVERPDDAEGTGEGDGGFGLCGERGGVILRDERLVYLVVSRCVA